MEAKGDMKEAFNLQKRLTHYKDSVSQVNVPLQIEQLMKQSELEKIEIEREKDKAILQRNHLFLLGMSLAFILLCVLLYQMRRSSKKLKEKNKVLFKQYKEANKLATYAKKILISTEELSEESSLFDRINTYLVEKKAYADPDLTRESLAKELNTNRQYLTEAIREETGKSFLEYINHFRLNDAYQKLIEDEKKSVNSIIMESGFSSTPTFYRLFKAEFGMSPNELRQVKKNF